MFGNVTKIHHNLNANVLMLFKKKDLYIFRLALSLIYKCISEKRIKKNEKKKTIPIHYHYNYHYN